MKLIAGLGNPGSRYERTRHNVGFMAADRLLQRFGLSFAGAKFGSPFVCGNVLRESVAFIKPMSYMNLSGRPLREAANFYKIEVADILVIHDEIDLPFETVRYKTGGGHAGHNGLRSIIAELGSADFHRIRIGVDRPPRGFNAADYVLSDFAKSQMETLDETFNVVAELVETKFLAGKK